MKKRASRKSGNMAGTFTVDTLGQQYADLLRLRNEVGRFADFQRKPAPSSVANGRSINGRTTKRASRKSRFRTGTFTADTLGQQYAGLLRLRDEVEKFAAFRRKSRRYSMVRSTRLH
jgi:hypothetical protein